MMNAPPQNPPRSSFGRRILLGVLVVAVGVLLYLRQNRIEEANAPSLSSTGKPIYTRAVQSEAPEKAQEEITSSRRNAIVRAVERIKPAVVSISAVHIQEVVYVDPFDWFFPDRRRRNRKVYKRRHTWTGSGFIVSSEGYVWTNEHIVRGATEILVSLPDGKEYEAALVGADHSSDVAVLKIEGKDIPFVRLGDSDDVLIGEWAIAIGNPFGHLISKGDPSVAVGVISATGRDFSPQEGAVYRDMIQTDASINRGNSGGPLANGLGEVIGINTFIMTGSQWEMGSVGVGFAISINKVRKVAEEIVRYGKVRPFWTGIRIQDMDRLLAQSLGLESSEGSLVSEVERSSPADRAGLRVGDVIVRVNEKKVKNSEETWNAFQEGTVGEVYRAAVIRDGAEVEVAIRLEQAP